MQRVCESGGQGLTRGEDGNGDADTFFAGCTCGVLTSSCFGVFGWLTKPRKWLPAAAQSSPTTMTIMQASAAENGRSLATGFLGAGFGEAAAALSCFAGSSFSGEAAGLAGRAAEEGLLLVGEAGAREGDFACEARRVGGIGLASGDRVVARERCAVGRAGPRGQGSRVAKSVFGTQLENPCPCIWQFLPDFIPAPMQTQQSTDPLLLGVRKPSP